VRLLALDRLEKPTKKRVSKTRDLRIRVFKRLQEYFYYFFIDFTKLGSQIMDDSLSSTSFENV